MNKGIYFASFTAMLWGFLAIALKVSLSNLSPVDVTWFRFTLAFIALFIYYSLFDRRKITILAKPPPMALLAGACLGMNYFGFISGINYTTPAISQIFMQSGPVMLAISGFVIFKERASTRQLIGLGLVLCGLLVFYREQILVLADDISKYNKGVFWVFIGAVSWTCYAIFQKPLVQKHDPMQLNLIIFGLPSLAFAPFVNFSYFPQISTNEWLLLIFLGLNTLAAYGSLAFALKYLDANKISVIITCNPILTMGTMAVLGAIGVSWIELEKFSLLTIVGACIVIFGAIFTVIRKRKRKA